MVERSETEEGDGEETEAFLVNATFVKGLISACQLYGGSAADEMMKSSSRNSRRGYGSMGSRHSAVSSGFGVDEEEVDIGEHTYCNEEEEGKDTSEHDDERKRPQSRLSGKMSGKFAPTPTREQRPPDRQMYHPQGLHSTFPQGPAYNSQRNSVQSTFPQGPAYDSPRNSMQSINYYGQPDSRYAVSIPSRRFHTHSLYLQTDSSKGPEYSAPRHITWTERGENLAARIGYIDMDIDTMAGERRRLQEELDRV
jgi:hypothetical protein